MKKYSLSGDWSFCLDEAKKGIQEEYFNKSLADVIQLPSTTALQKKGTYNTKKETGFLTEEYPFSGYAWYQKTITIEEQEIGKPMKLYLERTRITKVWINGQYAGTYDSLCTPHEYDITNFITDATLVITILVDNCDYVTKGGHLTSPDSQTNWNGIIGELSLRVYDQIYIENPQIYPEIENRRIKVSYEIVNTTENVRDITISFVGDKLALYENGTINRLDGLLKQTSITETVLPGVNHVTSTYELYDEDLWSEYNPVYYELEMAVNKAEYDVKVPFGLREFKAEGLNFYINGHKTFLRGKHDSMNFPLTGACPTNLEEWIKVMSISKSYGINHYRYHTCCPPDAAFAAANLLGIYMEPELPFWGSLTAPGEEGYNEEEQDFLIKEGERMLKTFGNHPSYCFMSLGNELWGSSKRMAEILSHYKAMDTRHLYTEGSNNFQFTPVILEEDDFFVGVRFSKDRLIRGSYAMCDRPLGFVQTDAPNSVQNYDSNIIPKEEEEDTIGNQSEDGMIEIQFGTGTKKVKAADSISLIPKKPVISHEIGQYAVYPNFEEISEYTGPLKARNFEIFRERLEKAGMFDLAKDYFECSGHLSVDCYKLELEAAHRSKYLAGYQILDLQDFSGQGTALVGILNACMNSKGLVTPEKWRQFCSDAVIMAGFEEFSMEGGKTITSNIVLSYYRQKPLELRDVEWRLCKEEEVISSGSFRMEEVEAGVSTIGSIEIELPIVSTTTTYQFQIGLADTNIQNSYELTLHPQIASQDPILLDTIAHLEDNSTICDKGETVYIARTLVTALEHLEKKEKVLLVPILSEEHSIEGQYCTDFWCYSMFKGICEWMKKPIPVGTMGVLNENNHKALKEFACERYATPQWYHLVMNSRLAILDTTDHAYRPIVQMMDNFERNHKLGLLFEACVAGGRLMVCTSDLSKGKDCADVVQFTKSIVTYMLSDQFNPEYEMSKEELTEIIC
ncbi:MAG: glycoside hydrolase family 2 TIM barrel-domain containing protein [bacterium]|nr:glycoside hydrolase family 2 TIM barrel-domain containing protein [bacterium]